MKKILAASAILASLLPNLQATPVFSDSFNYPDGGIVANSGGIWINNTGTAGTCVVSNQELIVTIIPSTRTEDIAHQFGTVFATNGPVTALYSSYNIRGVNLPTLAGTYMSHFTGSNVFGALTGHRGRVWLSTTNFGAGTGTAPGEFMIGIVNNGLGNATNGQWATPLLTNTTYKIVTRYVLGTGVSTIWVNPTAESDPSVTASDPVPNDDVGFGPTNGLTAITHYSFRQATGEGTSAIDDLKIGTQFNDVAGTNTSPTISPIPDQTTPMNVVLGPINFTVGDDGPTSSLILSNATSNAALVTGGGIALGGSGDNRTVTITPVTGAQGTVTITIYVSDGFNTASSSFEVTIGAPSISHIPNQITYMNTATPAVPFTIGDTESAASSLTLSKSSGNPTLIPDANIVFGGSGANRTVTLTPAAGQTGVATITIGVNDGTNTVNTNFVVSVGSQLGVLLSDTFSYTVFLQDTALLGADGSPWGHASGTNYDLLVIDGAAELSFQKSEDLAADLAGGPFAANSGQVFYFGFHTVLTNLPSNQGNYFCHLKDSLTGTTFRAKVYASTTNAAVGQFRIGIANAANDVSVQFPQDLNLDETNVVIVRYNSGTGESALWLNPSSEASAHVSATDLTTAAQVGSFGLRQDSGMGINHLDDLIVGTSMNDLASLLSPAEPPLSPIPLTIQPNGGSVILSWTNSAFFLQSATAVHGPYTTIAGAASPYTNAASGTTFFRLVHTNSP